MADIDNGYLVNLLKGQGHVPLPRPRPSLLDQARYQYPILKNYDIGYKYSPGKSSNMLESWQPGETGTEDYKRPAEFPMDKLGIEVFNHQTRPIDVLGDVVSHYLVNKDPRIKQYYSNFSKSISPDQENRLQEQYQWAQKNENEARPYQQWREMSGLPAYFRGYPFQQWPSDFNQTGYTPEQRQNLDDMMNYLQGNKKF